MGIQQVAGQWARLSMQTGPNGSNKVYFGLLKPGIHVAPEQEVILAYQKPYDHDGIAVIGAVAFDTQHLVTIFVADGVRGHGIAKALLDFMDLHVGRQLPDDGLRTRPGAGLLNHLGRPKGKFRRWVSEHDALRPVQRLVGFGSFGWSEAETVTKVFNP